MTLRAALAAAIAAASIVVPATLAAADAAAAAPEAIYTGRIITMDPARPDATAVAVAGGRIVAVGGDEVLARRAPTTRVVELGRRAMLPGFIDAHGHLTAIAAYIGFVNLAPPPAGPVRDIEALQAALRQRIAEERIPPGQWVVGVGYDDSLLAEKRHPDRDDLDAVSKDHPVLVVHVSGHLSAGNSALLAALGIDATITDPPGGVYRRRAGAREPDGVFEEIVHYAVVARLPRPTAEQAIGGISRTMDHLASMGLTTVQDGGTNADTLGLLRAAGAAGKLPLDVIAYRYWSVVGAALPDDQPFGIYDGRLKIDGVKLILDGSPQGKTAFLSAPYAVPPAGRGSDYRGYPNLPEPVVRGAVTEALRRGIPLLAHANGDAAAEMLIDAVERSGVAQRPRVVMIHAQTVRDDQLDRMKALGMVPSFFVSHTFFWGDWHRDETLGPERAARISPLRAAAERDIPYTLHNDPPVVPPDMIRTLWSATTRRTRSGAVLGPAQRATTLEALRAITLDAARQYGEEALKGSIAVGKQADFVVLSEDPLAMGPERLQDLRVLQTISRGRTVYTAP